MNDKDLASDRLRAKWDARYTFSGDTVPPPAEVLSRFAAALPAPGPAPGPALDLACGLAGNAEWLADRDYLVSAWDISAQVIDKVSARRGSRIATADVRDVIARPPEPLSFDVIVVSRFLERSLCPAIAAALRPGGVLFYQTFTHGLSNADYLLQPGELPRLFKSLQVLHHREPPPDARGRAEAMLVASALAGGDLAGAPARAPSEA